MNYLSCPSIRSLNDKLRPSPQTPTLDSMKQYGKKRWKRKLERDDGMYQ